MNTRFDRIIIAVPELSLAVEQYRQLFGCPPLALEGEPGAWWGLSNTLIEVIERPVEKPELQGFVLASPSGGREDAAVANSLGLDIGLNNGSRTSEFRASHSQAQCSGLRVDHLVLRTRDAQACIDLFAGQMGIRLALDKTAPDWGGRMLFFRAGKLTLEVIASSDESSANDYFWGIAYQCPDIEALALDLGKRGVALSGIREGRKPGTRVATLKSHALGIPTLLIEPAT